jgi:hypothetical protein
MLPIALGMGDGGRILQPLGIAVSGGLWVSMGLTLFVVPALQVAYLKRQGRKTRIVAVTDALPGLTGHRSLPVGAEWAGIQGPGK